MKFPLSRDEAMRVLSPYMWEYEKKEIMEYDVVYFFNINERIKNANNQHNLPGGASYGKI